MSNRAGVLTFTDLSQVQKTRENNELEPFLSEMSVNRPSDLVSKISVIFQNGSAKRSHFFMDFKYREFASMRMGANYQMPVFGVKGETPKISRKANYVQLLFASEEELAGANFNDVVFGTNYLTGEETVELTDSELVQALSSRGGKPGCTVRSEWADTAAHIVEKLWEASEKEPRTRFVIEMDRAGSSSMNLLQQVFLLIPQRLRLQLGFMTNISAQDLGQIQSETVPIYLMTADSRESIDPGRYTFPVVIFRLKDEDRYPYNAQRLALIKKLAESVNDKFISVLDNAEKEYLDAKDEVSSSFKYYGEIVSKLFTGGNFWWKNNNYASVSELKRAYDAQSELMKQEDFRREAFADFYMNIYPNSGIAEDAINLLESPESDERTAGLTFLAGKLGQTKLLNAIAGFGNRTRAKERAAGEAAQKQLAAGYEQRLSRAAQEKAAVDGELHTMQSRFASLEAQNKELLAENKRVSAENARFQSERDSADAAERSGRGKKGGENPFEEVGERAQGGDERNAKREKAYDRLKKEVLALRKQRVILMAAAGVAALLAILFLVLFLTKKPAPAATESEKSADVTLESVAEPASSEEVAAESSAEESSVEETASSESTAAESEESSAVSLPGISSEESAESGENAESSGDTVVTLPGMESGAESAQESTETAAPGITVAGTLTAEQADAVKKALDTVQGEEKASALQYKETTIPEGAYYHIKFSDKMDPASLDEMTEDPKQGYIGVYVSSQVGDTTNPQYANVYTWYAAQDLPINTGIKANWFDDQYDTDYYLHMAAKAAEDGAGFSTDETAEGASYIGWCITESEADPTDPAAYTWVAVDEK